jgi:hypothetical protein
MTSRATVLGFVIAALAAAPANGWTGAYDGAVSAGPALTASGTAWADGPFQGAAMTIKRAPLDGAATVLYSVARGAPCDRVDDLAAAGDLVAVQIFRGAADGSCVNEGIDILVNDGAGGAKTLESTAGGFSMCAASGLDVDAGIVAVARYNCEQTPVMLHDVAAGTAKSLGLTLPIGVTAVDVRMAGRFVAVILEVVGGGPGPRVSVRVWDREAGAEAYRVDADAFRGGSDYAIGSHRLELQPDGRVLYGVTTTGPVAPRWGTASPGDPVLRSIPGDFDHSMGRSGFAGNLAVLKRGSGRGSAVFGLDGAMLNLFSPQPTGWSVDFDGSRLAWSDFNLVHNEPYPYEPPAPAPAPATKRPAPSLPEHAAAPAARATGIKAISKAKALKAFSGTAGDPDGDLLMVRVGLVRVGGGKCQTLQRSGWLKASKSARGKCLPAAFLTASGTKAWKLKLRRRLPAGKYLLYVQAVDAAGHAQMTFAKASGNLRAFRLK